MSFFLLFAGIVFVQSQEVKSMKEAYFAGGCFWCMEKPFELLDGVSEVISGYAGGPEKDPTYREVASGRTGHIESIKVVYDENKLGYQDLLNVFWRQIDPTDGGGQFVDRGMQYSTAIFYVDEEQQKLAAQSKEHLEKAKWFARPIITEIRKFESFYRAEEYHQDYYKKSKFRYNIYRAGSGRDQFLAKVWGSEVDDTDEIPIKK